MTNKLGWREYKSRTISQMQQEEELERGGEGEREREREKTPWYY